MCTITHCHNLKDRNYVDTLVKWVTCLVNLTTGLFERCMCVKMKLTTVLQQLNREAKCAQSTNSSSSVDSNYVSMYGLKWCIFVVVVCVDQNSTAPGLEITTATCSCDQQLSLLYKNIHRLQTKMPLCAI